MDIILHIILQKPPTGVDFGIQKGSGSKYETIQTQRSDGGDIQFSLTIQLKNDAQKINEPRFTGPFVQGKPGSQFFYIDVGTYAGQEDGWSRRIKIPLTNIGWDIIDLLHKHPEAVLSASVPGTGKDGGPSCATVKPSQGWQVDTGIKNG
ncbi:MAG: DUF5990 family protein [Flavipsychrobacter sp.]